MTWFIFFLLSFQNTSLVNTMELIEAFGDPISKMTSILLHILVSGAATTACCWLCDPANLLCL